jgi:hypothetical protein
MDHIPVGEIASQLPMFIDPTTIVDNVLAGYWDAADALGNSPYVGDPEGLWDANAMALLMAAFTEGDRALGYWGAVGSLISVPEVRPRRHLRVSGQPRARASSVRPEM